MKFYGAYTLLVIAFITLSAIAIQFCVLHPGYFVILSHFLMSSIWSFSLLGIGLGFMILAIATLFSWGQLYLLVTGSIDPHLVKADFFKVLETFLNSLFEPKAR